MIWDSNLLLCSDMKISISSKNKYEEAAKQFEALANSETDKIRKSQAYHNMGNSLLQARKYDESVEAYKQALRNNPKDQDTRYNLEYAKKLLQKQQEQQKQDQQNKEEVTEFRKKSEQFFPFALGACILLLLETTLRNTTFRKIP